MRSVFYLLLLFLIALPSSFAESSWPQRPIKVIVPFGAGGGSDTFARQLIRSIEDQQLLPQPLVVINVGGAGGTIGSRRVKNARPDGYTMLMLHEGMLTAKYAAKAAYGPEAFEPIAGTGKIGVVLTVKQGSPYTTMQALMNQAAANQNSLNFAANIGAPSHFVGLMVEKSKENALFNFVQYGGGADRYGAIMGDHAHLSIFSVEEYLRYKDGGLKALAIFDQQRQQAIPDVPTAIEQGFEINTSNMHFWWMPKGTSKEICSIMADTIEKAMQSDSMKAFMETSWTQPLTLKGQALLDEISRRESNIQQVSLRKIDILPNFETWIISIVLFLSIAVLIRRFKDKSSDESQQAFWNPTSLLGFGVTLIYVLALSAEAMSYPILTSVYVFCLGMIISLEPKKSLVPMIIYSGVISFGLFYLFTRVLVVDLPG